MKENEPNKIANLYIRLYADNTVVATSWSPELWQEVLQKIMSEQIPKTEIKEAKE